MEFTRHVPILVGPIVQSLIEPLLTLKPSEPCWIVDCTLGGGGHCSELLKALESDPTLQHHRVLALDRDAQAIARAHVRFQKEIAEGKLELVHRPFGESADLVAERPVMGLMADLGFSSDQLEDGKRGISFQKDGPLDMRLDPSRGQSCYQLLQQISEKELWNLLSELGEERFSHRIATAIVQKRREGALPKTTSGLVDVILKAVPPAARYGRIHAATRTFQALRIAVNEELTELDHLLEDVIVNVRPGGRIAILSFHSLEDRKVKEAFKNRELFIRMTKKPIQADEEEVQRNPRSRSAKLRIAEVLEKPEGLAGC